MIYCGSDSNILLISCLKIPCGLWVHASMWGTDSESKQCQLAYRQQVLTNCSLTIFPRNSDPRNTSTWAWQAVFTVSAQTFTCFCSFRKKAKCPQSIKSSNGNPHWLLPSSLWVLLLNRPRMGRDACLRLPCWNWKRSEGDLFSPNVCRKDQSGWNSLIWEYLHRIQVRPCRCANHLLHSFRCVSSCGQITMKPGRLGLMLLQPVASLWSPVWGVFFLLFFS